MPSQARVSGKKVVLASAAFGIVFAVVLAWVFQYSRRDIERSKGLPAIRQTATGEMILVPVGKFRSGEEQTPVNWSAFYIDRKPRGAQVTWEQAKEACAAAGFRLPVPIEWEKAAALKLIEHDPAQWEWTNDPRTPFQGEVSLFQGELTPPPTRDERWTTVRGGASVTKSAIYPARYAAPDLVYRCVVTP